MRHGGLRFRQLDSGPKATPAIDKKSTSRTSVKRVRFGPVTFQEAPVHPLVCSCADGPESETPMYACASCMGWHYPSCLAIKAHDICGAAKVEGGSSAPAALALASARCLDCRKQDLYGKLCNSARRGDLPPFSKLSEVCRKLNLPTGGTFRDLVCRLIAFLPVHAADRATRARLAGVGSTAQRALMTALPVHRLQDLCQRLGMSKSDVRSYRGSDALSSLALSRLFGPTRANKASASARPGDAKNKSSAAPARPSVRKPLSSVSENTPAVTSAARAASPAEKGVPRVGRAKKRATPTPKPAFSIVRIRKMLGIFTASQLRSECRAYGLPTGGRKVEMLSRLSRHLYDKQPRVGKGKGHSKSCKCDLCDLQLVRLAQCILRAMQAYISTLFTFIFIAHCGQLTIMRSPTTTGVYAPSHANLIF